jgi:hypothetical protein
VEYIGESSLERPGIYRWQFADKAYVGRFTKQSRLLNEYPKNVFRLLNGIHYRPKDPMGFRAIHRALADAVASGTDVTLTILENCQPDELNARERLWTSRLDPMTKLNGMPRRP